MILFPYLTASLHPRINLGPLVDKVLRRAHMSHKQFALNAAIDFSEWSRAVQGKARIDVRWLIAQPWEFHAAFVPLYLEAVGEMLTDEYPALRMVKARLPEKSADRKEAS